jgi:CRP/FNR family transcriptional regulator, nitrogen oxide reductase regulator
MSSSMVSESHSPQRNGSVVKLSVAQRVALMCASALFTDLSVSACEAIASCATAREFAHDELLFMEGQEARHLVLLQSGSAKVTQTSAGGNEVILRVAGKGDLVTTPQYSSHCHTCSARAMEQCHALAWEYKRLSELIVEYPQIASNISRILSDRLDQLQEQFREVATEKVAQRLALALLRLVKQVGKPAQGGTKVSLSREDLAQMTGTTLFTVSRLLSKWGEEGFVLPQREAVVVLDARRLERMGAE